MASCWFHLKLGETDGSFIYRAIPELNYDKATCMTYARDSIVCKDMLIAELYGRFLAPFFIQLITELCQIPPKKTTKAFLFTFQIAFSILKNLNHFVKVIWIHFLLPVERYTKSYLARTCYKVMLHTWTYLAHHGMLHVTKGQGREMKSLHSSVSLFSKSRCKRWVEFISFVFDLWLEMDSCFFFAFRADRVPEIRPFKYRRALHATFLQYDRCWNRPHKTGGMS